MDEVQLSERFDIIADASCRVCGEDYLERTEYVCCPGCQTPSHQDCFEYQGGCPIFACNYKLDEKTIEKLQRERTLYVQDDEGKYEINYGGFTRARKNYFDSLEQFQEGYRMSLSSEERAIQKYFENQGVSIDLSFLIGTLSNGFYPMIRTATALRIPKGTEPGKYDEMLFKKTGKIKYFRDVVEFEKVVAEGIPIPKGDGLVITKWNELYGIPEETQDIDYPHTGYTTHFWFSPDKEKVAVSYRKGWPLIGDIGCMRVYAHYSRYDADLDVGFRSVQGPLPRRDYKKVNGLWQKAGEILTNISDLFP